MLIDEIEGCEVTDALIELGGILENRLNRKSG